MWFVAKREVLSRLERVYFRTFSFFPLAIGFVSIIPFLGVVVVSSIMGILFNPVERVYYDDSHIRIQSTFQGVLTGAKIDIFEKKGFFERQVDIPGYHTYDLDSVFVSYDIDSTRIFLYGVQTEIDSLPLIVGIDKVN